jgi:hypothetical protein
MRTIDETSSATEKLIADLNERIRVLESNKKDDYDQKQKTFGIESGYSFPRPNSEPNLFGNRPSI